jgi:hypothetical protein
MLLMGSPKSTLGNDRTHIFHSPSAERRLASPRAASCLTPSGVLPHPERRLASQEPFDPGLATKPIIDIAVVIAEDQVRFAIAQFESHGFENFGEMGIACR